VEAGPRSYDREYFGDPVHLNERGAQRFNLELVAQLPDILSVHNRRQGPLLP